MNPSTSHQPLLDHRQRFFDSFLNIHNAEVELSQILTRAPLLQVVVDLPALAEDAPVGIDVTCRGMQPARDSGENAGRVVLTGLFCTQVSRVKVPVVVLATGHVEARAGPFLGFLILVTAGGCRHGIEARKLIVRKFSEHRAGGLSVAISRQVNEIGVRARRFRLGTFESEIGMMLEVFASPFVVRQILASQLLGQIRDLFQYLVAPEHECWHPFRSLGPTVCLGYALCGRLLFVNPSIRIDGRMKRTLSFVPVWILRLTLRLSDSRYQPVDIGPRATVIACELSGLDNRYVTQRQCRILGSYETESGIRERSTYSVGADS